MAPTRAAEDDKQPALHKRKRKRDGAGVSVGVGVGAGVGAGGGGSVDVPAGEERGPALSIPTRQRLARALSVQDGKAWRETMLTPALAERVAACLRVRPGEPTWYDLDLTLLVDPGKQELDALALAGGAWKALDAALGGGKIGTVLFPDRFPLLSDCHQALVSLAAKRCSVRAPSGGASMAFKRLPRGTILEVRFDAKDRGHGLTVADDHPVQVRFARWPNRKHAAAFFRTNGVYRRAGADLLAPILLPTGETCPWGRAALMAYAAELSRQAQQGDADVPAASPAHASRPPGSTAPVDFERILRDRPRDAEPLARQILGLPAQGVLNLPDVNRAFRGQAQRHPDKCPEESKAAANADYTSVVAARDHLKSLLSPAGGDPRDGDFT